MRKQDYVSIEVAKLLQEKGFREPCKGTYLMEFKGEFALRASGFRQARINDLCRIPSKKIQLEYLAPSITMVQEWLWEKHMMLVGVFLVEPFAEPYKYSYAIQSPLNGLDNYGTIVCKEDFDSVWAAWNAGFLSALDSIESTNNEVKPVISENNYG